MSQPSDDPRAAAPLPCTDMPGGTQFSYRPIRRRVHQASGPGGCSSSAGHRCSMCWRTVITRGRYWSTDCVGAHEDTDFEEEYRAVFRTLPPSGRALEINTLSPMAVAEAAGFGPGCDRFDFWRR